MGEGVLYTPDYAGFDYCCRVSSMHSVRHHDRELHCDSCSSNSYFKDYNHNGQLKVKS